jgi:Polyketide cyclase / dehydrase and lipid transport
MTDLEFSDSVLVNRSPDEVYALVSDVTRMGQWSPTCKACWWDEGGGPEVGSWFTGRNETSEGRSEATGEIVSARTWETRSQVVAADPGREFAWEVNDGWVHWGFTLEPAEGPEGSSEAAGKTSQRTRLTQNWRFLAKGIAGFHERFGDRADTEIAIRSEAAKSGIPQTLAAIKASAEA